AYVIYTSGSTGRPKGVMVRRRGLLNYLCWAGRAYAPESGVGAPLHSSLSFDLSVTSIFLPLLAGRRLELLAGGHDAEALAAALAGEAGYSLVKLTPAHLRLLAAGAGAAPGASRALVVGGESLTWEAVRAWRGRAPGTRIFNEYGPTETVVGSSVYEAEAGAGRAGEAVPIGRPIANTQLYVLDAGMEPAAVGVVGELYIGGAGVARGYVNRAGLTAERFIPDPHGVEAGARLYRTGDLGRYLADGQVEYVGRADSQVKVRGYRIELGEVEAALSAHASVGECVVAVRGEEDGKRLVAYVVARAGQAVGAAELREQLAQRLPAYMVPSAYVFLDELPLTRNGKVDRRALPSPEANREQSSQSYEAPRNAVEEQLVAIWQEVLGLERIGIRDNFFELGGHSLLATQVFSRVRAVFEVELPFSLIFEAPTVADFVAAAEELRGSQHTAAPVAAAPAIVPVSRDKYRVGKAPSPVTLAGGRADAEREEDKVS
ncbi:MAG TPA: non-ribosomal peptide synthetase, partial [Pyrinomonadaceae bacterium]